MSLAEAGVTPQDHGPRSASDQDLLARFLARRDETAFAALVQRYSGAVWGVCRRLLPQEQDAEDAFQAVFLILARKAAAIRKGEAVGSWLYGVAYRTALKARQTEARRRNREKQAAGADPEQPPWSEAACRELQQLLDEEVQRLPEKYRAPFVLCCLEGLSKTEAAQELGWKAGTVSGRVSQARKLLQTRLARRGVTLSAVLTTIALTQKTAAAAAPPVLVEAAVQAVRGPGAARANAGALSPAVLALAQGVLNSMARTRFTVGIALLLALPLFAAGVGLAAYHLGFSPNSRQGLTVEATAVRIVTRPGGQRPGPLPVDSEVVTLAFSPDGKRLVTAGSSPDRPGHLRICDVATARELVTLPGIPGTRCVAFAPDGQGLASGEFSGDIKLRDPATGLERASWQGHTGGVSSVLFSSDGQSLVSAGLDGTVKLWDVKERQERQTFVGHTDGVAAAAYFCQGQALVTGSRDRTATVWDVATGQARFTLRGHQDEVEAVAVSPDDKWVATASRDRTVRLWDAGTGKETAVLEGDHAVHALAFSPDGKLLASAADRTIHFWDVATRQRVKSLKKQAAAISVLAFSPNGHYLANGSSLGLVLLALQFTEVAGGKEYKQSFQGGAESCPGWELIGQDAERDVHFEPDGLRITLPVGYPERRMGIGVSNALAVKGDFEITVRFEILQEPVPADTPQATAVNLDVVLDRSNLPPNRAALLREVGPRGVQFAAWKSVRDEAPGKVEPKEHAILTQARTGQLRLVRTGSLLSYYVAEGPGKEFLLLKQFPFRREDVSQVKLVGSTGGPRASFDVRITDLCIRSEFLPNLPAAPSTQGRSKGWLASAVLLLLGLIFSLLMWYFVRRRRQGAMLPSLGKDKG